jgi:hypothetical protein
MITLRCPCGKQLRVKEELAGRKVRCPGCAEVVPVPASQGVRAKPETAPSAAQKTRERRVRDEEETEQEEPRSRRERDSDDGQKRKKRKRKKGGSSTGLIVGLIAAAVLALGGGGVGLFFLLRSKSSEPVARGKDPANAGANPAANPGAGVGATSESAQQLANNLKQLTIGMQNYNETYKKMPAPAFTDPKERRVGMAKSFLSWRVTILPYIDQGDLYKQFKLDEPWDSPHNIKLLPRMPKTFEPVPGQVKAAAGQTYLQLVTGPGTLHPTPIDFAAIPRSFVDGTSNTVLIVEAAEAVPWTKPADFNIDVSDVTQGSVPRLGSISPNGFYASMADGSVRFVDRRRTSDKTIRQAFNSSDGLPLGADW